MSMVRNRSLYLLLLFSPEYGCGHCDDGHAVSETVSDVPVPEHPPYGGVCGLHGVLQ